jgi:hypothetical protein
MEPNVTIHFILRKRFWAIQNKVWITVLTIK